MKSISFVSWDMHAVCMRTYKEACSYNVTSGQSLKEIVNSDIRKYNYQYLFHSIVCWEALLNEYIQYGYEKGLITAEIETKYLAITELIKRYNLIADLFGLPKWHKYQECNIYYDQALMLELRHCLTHYDGKAIENGKLPNRINNICERINIQFKGHWVNGLFGDFKTMEWLHKTHINMWVALEEIRKAQFK